MAVVEHEARGIAAFLKRRIDANAVDAGNILVLSPRRDFGIAIRNQLLALDVDAKSFFNEQELDGNPKESDKNEKQQAFTLLTLLARPTDAVALRSWCGFDHPLLAAREWSAVKARCEATNLPVRVVLEQLQDGSVPVLRTEHVKRRLAVLTERETATRGLAGQDLVDALFPDGPEWAVRLRELCEPIVASDAAIEATGLLEELQRAISQPEVPTTVTYVRVMSLHKSKGLTADLVVIAGCMQGVIPDEHNPNRTDLTPEQYLEEQRRLFFVGVTRTRDTLVLSSVIQVPAAQSHRMGVQARRRTHSQVTTRMSDFVAQLGPDVPRAENGQAFLRTALTPNSSSP